MELLNLPRLRNKELQTIGEQSIRICGNITEVKPALEKAKASLEIFKQGMQKDKSSGISKKELDRQRDQLITAMFMNIKAETYFDYTDEAMAQTLAKLTAIMRRYTGVTRLAFNEQTAAVDNLLDELKKLNLPAETLPVVQRWLPLIETANAQFKTASSTIIADSAQMADISAASLVAPQLIEDLQNLYTLVFAHARISDNANTSNAYKELQILINSVN